LTRVNTRLNLKNNENILIYIYIDNWRTKNNEKTKMEHLAYDVKVIYLKKLFSQKFVDYLGPTEFNSMPVLLKRI